MEEEKYWEQPNDFTLEENALPLSEENGSQSEPLESGDESKGEEKMFDAIGKFKNEKSLLDAYTALEKEFTKKCQKLAEYEKDKVRESENNEKILDEKLSAFLSNNGEAQEYRSALFEKVKSDESLSKMADPFSYAWADMLFSKLKSEKTDDNAVLTDYVLGNEQLKNAVIKSYVNQLAENKSPIKISSSGSRVATNMVTPKPENMKEAKDYLYNLFS